MDFGQWFRKERLRRGWSQAAVARRVGVTPGQMNNIEKGRSRAGTEVLARLLALYETTPADILKQEEIAQMDQAPQQEAPDHPGVRELAANAEACRAHHIAPEELQELASLVLIRRGQAVSLQTAQEALQVLQSLRTLGPP